MLSRIQEILDSGGAAGVIEILLDRDSEDRAQAPVTRFEGLEPFTDLEVLSATGQELQSFAGLPPLPRLHSLFLQGNHIESLQGMPLLPALHTLDLSLNRIEEARGLPALPQLQTLDLSHNRLESLIGMPALPALHSLTLSGNRGLRSLEGLPHAAGLQALHLRGAYLRSYEALAGATALRTLSLSPMSLDSLGQWPPHLRQLNLFAGRMEGVVTLPELPQLRQLHMRNGAMVTAVEGWEGLPLLETAALSGLGLRECPAFPAGMPLRELDLSRNRIQRLDPLIPCTHLKVLRLAGNPVDEATIRTFRESRPDVRLEG